MNPYVLPLYAVGVAAWIAVLLTAHTHLHFAFAMLGVELVAMVAATYLAFKEL